MRNWYRFENAAGGAKDVADIHINDQIGKSFWNDDAVSAAKFIAELKALPDSVKTIRVHVNSPGGNPFDASAIANALQAERTDRARAVEVRITGLAASAATIITSAGQPIRIADNAMMMIHEPSAVAMGPSSTMRQVADTLDTIRTSIIAAYRWVSKKSEDELSAMMAATTWMTAQEAIDNGLATEVMAGTHVTACFSVDAVAALGELPAAHRARIGALIKQPEPAPVPARAEEILSVVAAAGLEISAATELVAAGLPLPEITARVTAKKAAKEAEAARVRDITTLCEREKQPELAPGFIASNMAVDAVSKQLLVVKAKIDAATQIDATLPPTITNGATPLPTSRQIYEARRASH